MWTKFWDMHSGGDLKEGNYSKIYVELPKEQAITYFYNRFGHNPERISCTCCGEDYSISEAETLAQASGFHRGARLVRAKYGASDWSIRREKDEISVEEYIKSEDVLVIYAKDIKKEECFGEVPTQGYVWVD